ncbi:branched-chain amino acid ABC transporter permease [Nocardioides sp. AN3]
MSELVQLLVAGVTVGIIYATIAVGYATIYSATGVISFTLGAQAMVSGYLFYVVLAPWPPLPSAVASVALGAITSLALWIVVFEPIFRREGAMPTVIASFAVSVVMQETVRILASADVRAAPSPFGESILRIRGVAITAHTLGTIAMAGILLAAVGLAFRSRRALLVKAIFQDRMMAQALGVKDSMIINLIFLVSGAATAVAGVLLAPLSSLTPFTGVYIALVGFVGATLGGITGVAASALGAILLGVVQSLFAGYVSASYTNALVFGVLAVVLILKPSGLLTTHERARV